MDRKQRTEDLRQAEQLCTKRGARLTKQRRTVLELLCATHTPLSAYELLDRMRVSFRNPAPTTVYRALDFPLDQGLVHKLESLHAFVGCTHPEELENDAVVECLQSAANTTGFKTKRPVVELWGTCAQCSRKHPEGR